MGRYSKRRVTIVDVAELAGVSIATVSKVLNGKDEHISAETKELVRETAEKLEYIPNDMARHLKDLNSRTIGLLIPDISNAFPEMAQGAQDEAFCRGYNMFFCSTNSNPLQEEQMLKMLQARMVDGIIYVSSNYSGSERLLRQMNCPYVAIDRQMTGDTKGGAVRIDNYQAMYDVAKFIADKSFQHIGYITADISKSPSRERYEGLMDGLADCGINFDKRLHYPGLFNVETGHIGAMTLLQREPRLDCILCGNDMIAIGAIKVCQKMNRKIPEDIRIVGFDDIYISRYLNPELTTVKQDAYEMGRCAAEMLIEHVENGRELETIILPHEIIQRGTV